MRRSLWYFPCPLHRFGKAYGGAVELDQFLVVAAPAGERIKQPGGLGSLVLGKAQVIASGLRIGVAMALGASIETRAGNMKGLVFNFNSFSLSVNDQGSLMVGKPP